MPYMEDKGINGLVVRPQASTDTVLSIIPFGTDTATLAILGDGSFATASAYPTVWVGDHVPSTLVAPSDQVPVAGSVYYASLWIPANKTLTGAGYLIGSVGGTDKAIVTLYSSAGVKLANSATAGTTVGTAATFQEIAFTATYAAAGPARYWLSVSVDGTTCRIGLSVAGGTLKGSTTGSFGTLANITPPTARGAAIIGYVY